MRSKLVYKSKMTAILMPDPNAQCEGEAVLSFACTREKTKTTDDGTRHCCDLLIADCERCGLSCVCGELHWR